MHITKIVSLISILSLYFNYLDAMISVTRQMSGEVLQAAPRSHYVETPSKPQHPSWHKRIMGADENLTFIPYLYE